MKNNKTSLIIPVMLITLGIGWLLTALDIGPSIDWPWSLGLAAIGVTALMIYGIDKVTVAVGPFFIVASGLSLLRQMGHLRGEVEIPTLVITAGILLMIARLPIIPVPKWFVDSPRS